MSRGDRAIVSGNLGASMRDNYGEYGVAEYYKKVGSTYRNPHYPGIRLCLFSWLNRWWQMNQSSVINIGPDQIMFFDMACGFGEATLAFVEWCNTGKRNYQSSLVSLPDTSQSSTLRYPPLPQRKAVTTQVVLGPDFPKPRITAADPFTAAAYQDRTTYPCAELSFAAIAEGSLPSTSINIANGEVHEILPQEDNKEEEADRSIEMVVCSFALHLIENPSDLFALLWELSLKASWLVILAPHKKPEIKEGWGWAKWNTSAWEECRMIDSTGDLLQERVHCRVYRSVNHTPYSG
ncbi:hypothetical protein B0H34DRAFT_656803 [Crassisporium funariophilum]|nr:hypothetical protein B0H34DRAFT_656803 [Crassisporium funariophilum]